MKLKKSTKILIAVCIIGLSLLLYPTVSNYWNESHSTKAINSYVKALETVDTEAYERIWNEALNYNKELLSRPSPYYLTDDLKQKYPQELNLAHDGIMGYLEIGKLKVELPVYHGTSDVVLQRAVGHLDWTSLPVGGASSHCVISGHRGLPSAKLFTDLDRLREGDSFTLNILNEVLTYEIDQIRIVEPKETDDLLIEEGMDYCTLLTCTPYGINTHRLLVRGHRIENAELALHVVSEAVIIDPLIVAPVLAFPLLFLLLLIIMFKKPAPKKKTLEEIVSEARGGE